MPETGFRLRPTLRGLLILVVVAAAISTMIATAARQRNRRLRGAQAQARAAYHSDSAERANATARARFAAALRETDADRRWKLAHAAVYDRALAAWHSALAVKYWAIAIRPDEPLTPDPPPPDREPTPTRPDNPAEADAVLRALGLPLSSDSGSNSNLTPESAPR